MAAPILINHRRNRQQSRRFLREIVVNGSDLTSPFFQTDLDLLDGQSRRVFPMQPAFARPR